MILLRANHGLRQTFEKLIQTMKVPVRWNGIFAVTGNYMILQGEVRSLFFHFDSRKITTNIIEFPAKPDKVEETADSLPVQNVINMILYAFGKWGTLGGLKVEKNYQQLNRLFSGILKELSVEPEYNQEHFYFYQKKIRITYEDVIQLALEYEEKPPQEEREETGGLWHRLVWKRELLSFARVETSLRERQKERLGHNFYMVGYLCPSCKEKLHMAVYPEDREFCIGTDEGAVLLARAVTCGVCNCFYAARPKRLLPDGDVYVMRFGDDRKAYEDYLELLGTDARKVSNCRYNRYADEDHSEEETAEAGEKELENLCRNLEERSDEELLYLTDRMEEGFYRPESVRRYENRVKSFRVRGKRGLFSRGRRKEEKEENIVQADDPAEQKKADKKAGTLSGTDGKREKRVRPGDKGADERPGGHSAGEDRVRTSYRGASVPEREETDEGVPGDQGGGEETESVRQKYEARLAVMNRFSPRQLGELERQISREKQLAPDEQRELLHRVKEQLSREQAAGFEKKVESCGDKSYAVMKRIYDEVESSELFEEYKKPLLSRLLEGMKRQGALEVKKLMEHMPAGMDRAGYRKFAEKLSAYTNVDLTPYGEALHESRREAERLEIAGFVKRARKNSREDLADLARRLREGDFLPELAEPYLEKVTGRIRQLDEQRIRELLKDPAQMSFEEGMRAYGEIMQGDFLPELKEDALTMLTKRLARIKTDECELLAGKLKEELREAGIKENDRHHFYPAKKVLLGEAKPEETEVIDFAMASYAAGKGPFEYPVLVVDTSGKRTGKEGMILTPEHLYYSTLLHAYGIPVNSIRSVTCSGGFLSKGVYVLQKDGTKTKIPCAVDAKELKAYGDVLGEFVRYLQEKPDSRNVDYLAREKHDTICCYRCGQVYAGGTVCPRCGYQNNV